ncbi:MAG: acireductone synthase [Alphaproteobacteria bacterium]|nr:acireductone synthase [Alphaproteobacteria bacterium]MCD8526116.1 acireductone synthase [Alphaproteobacteria bacterium]MCD8570475.1 acireductone synthase [Alphaproteobacteria bacterium]
MIKAIVTDIEGTTSSISFVHDVLFPYAAERLTDYVRDHESEISGILDQVREMENDDSLSTEGVIKVMLDWIKQDKKATPLKALQGLIWEAGYKDGAFKGHIYDDAAEALQRWHGAGIKLYVYSSGSVPAQKLIYGYSRRGDLTPLFSGYFDTTTGPKLEAGSYRKIAESIGFPSANILFLSDNPGEITAAQEAGMQTVLVDRDGKAPGSVLDFTAINFMEKAA